MMGFVTQTRQVLVPHPEGAAEGNWHMAARASHVPCQLEGKQPDSETQRGGGRFKDGQKRIDISMNQFSIKKSPLSGST